MSNYVEMYHIMSSGTADALQALEAAKVCLLAAQKKAAEEAARKGDPADFIRAVTPYTKEQLSALLGEVPMSQELFNGILDGCFRWSETVAFAALEKRYPELVRAYEQERYGGAGGEK